MAVEKKFNCYAGVMIFIEDRTDDDKLAYRDKGHFVHNVVLLGGTADSEADQVWRTNPASPRRLAAAASETFDLTALTKTIFGSTLTLDPFVEIRDLMIINRTSVQGCYLLIGAASSNEWYEPFGAAGDTVKVPSGSHLKLSSLVDGWPVSGSSKNLKIENPSAVDVDYEICILGTTAASTSSSA